MKYLKKFNENQNTIDVNIVEKLKEKLYNEASNYLAYLLDEDWSINITEKRHYDGTHGIFYNYEISISYLLKDNYNSKIFKDWLEIKDYVIPYLEYIVDKYKVMDSFTCYSANDNTFNPMHRYGGEGIYDELSIKQLNRKRKLFVNELLIHISIGNDDIKKFSE